MKTEELVRTKKTQEAIQLVKGEFTASEAAHVLLSLLNEKINFHKIRRIQLWEADHSLDGQPFKNRIMELEKEKLVVQEFLADLKGSDQKLKINGVVEISIVE